MTGAHLLLALLIVGQVGARPPADASAEARGYLGRGVQLYNLQRYAEAIAQFEAGYQLAPLPEFLFALGQAERLSGDCQRAIKSYQAFLRAGPNERQQAAAIEHIRQCEAANAAPKREAPPLPQLSGAPELTPPPTGYVSPRLLWILGGAAGASFAAGLGLRIWAQVDFNQLSATCKPSCSPGAVNAIRPKEISGDVLMGLGAAAGLVDLGLLLLHPRRSGPARQATIVPTGNGLAVRGEF